MNSGKYVFPQVMGYFPRWVFDDAVTEYNGDYRMRMSCFTQCQHLLFGQLAGCKSLNEIELILKAHSRSLYHLGFDCWIGEKQKLLKAHNSEYSQFVTVYGRRRVGKTFFVRESFNYKFTFEHSGLAKTGMKGQLENWQSSMKYHGWKVARPKTWIEAFNQLKDLIIASDEICFVRRKRTMFCCRPGNQRFFGRDEGFGVIFAISSPDSGFLMPNGGISASNSPGNTVERLLSARAQT